MNVLQLTLSFLPGGRKRAIITLAEQLRKQGARCHLVCLDQLGCPPEEIDGVFASHDVLHRKSLLDWAAIRRLGDFCRDHQIEVIHAHDAASQFTAALLRSWRPQYKLLMTFHRSLGFESASSRDRARNAFANLLSGAIVTGSTERRRHFLEENSVRRERVIRIPFGIDTSRFSANPEAAAAIRTQLGLSRETIIVGAVGHFGHEKGIDAVIRGFQQLSGRALSRPVALVVVGSGTEAQQQALRALADSMPSSRVILAGFQRDVHRWMGAFDVFVHAPRLEAFGLVLVEAMASGLPVVATRVGGIPDIVRDGHTGILVPVDDPAALSDAMEQLIARPEMRAKMAEAARRVAVSEFSAERYAACYLEVYRALLHGRRPCGVDQTIRRAS